MNSDNIVNLLENLTSPIDSNKYIRGTLLVILLVNASYFVPQPLLPSGLVNALRNYALLSFIFTLLLSYLLTRDINVSIVASLLIYGLNYVNLKMERFENTNDVALLVNEYNYDLDRVIQKNKADHHNTIGFTRPSQIKIAPNNNPALPTVDDISKEEPTFNVKHRGTKRRQLQEQNLHIRDDFKFCKDNLRYLRYNPKKLNEYQDLVHNDVFSGNNVEANLE
jgi:hypothetical protein